MQAARDFRSEERQRKCNSYGLLTAAKKGCFDRVKLLIKDGVDPDTRNAYGMTALIKSAKAGRTEIVKFLIKAGANLDFRTMMAIPRWERLLIMGVRR